VGIAAVHDNVASFLYPINLTTNDRGSEEYEVWHGQLNGGKD